MANGEKTYPQFVQFGTDHNGFYGLICSPDNGQTITLLVGSKGRIYSKADADRLWQYLKPMVEKLIDEKMKNGGD